MTSAEQRKGRQIVVLFPTEAEVQEVKAMAGAIGWSVNSLLLEAWRYYKALNYGNNSPSVVLRSAVTASNPSYDTKVVSSSFANNSADLTNNYLLALNRFTEETENQC